MRRAKCPLSCQSCTTTGNLVDLLYCELPSTSGSAQRELARPESRCPSAKCPRSSCFLSWRVGYCALRLSERVLPIGTLLALFDHAVRVGKATARGQVTEHALWRFGLGGVLPKQ